MYRDYPTVFDLSTKQLGYFYSLIDRRGPDECWPWKGRRLPFGYGQIELNGVSYIASRLVLALTKGIPNRKLLTRHACDYPPCCNPRHLSTGTHADNNQDAKERGRNSRGERVVMGKLTERQVREIHALYSAQKYRRRELARIYGVHSSAIDAIISRRAWKHLDLPKIRHLNRGAWNGIAKLTPEGVREIRKLAAEGAHPTELARRFSVSRSNIDLIVKRKNWAWVSDHFPEEAA